MGKPERKARERTCSSSSYFLRCFGISRKVHSDKLIIDAVQETQKMKKKTRTRCFFQQPNFRLKNGEITPSPIHETEKQNVIVEDDKQNLFRVIRHVTDSKNIATSGFKSVEHESNEKDTNGQRDINPDPLCFLEYDTCHEGVSTTVRGGKHDPTKVVGSGSKPKELREKSSRVRKGYRVGNFDPIIGISIIMLTLMIMLIWGRLCAILCTSTWCYFLPRLREAATAVATAKRKRSGGSKAEDGSFPGDLDLSSEAYKKKVVLEGFLVRQHHILL